jgi:hypothetical protein
MDGRAWSAEQRSSIDAFLVAHWPLDADKAKALASNPDFLLDALYHSDPGLTSLALARLGRILGRELTPALSQNADERAANIEMLRSSLHGAPSTQPSTRQAP